MANTLSASNRLHKTYGPVQLADVRDADAARKVGRAKLREQGGECSEPSGNKSVPPPAIKCPLERKGGAK